MFLDDVDFGGSAVCRPPVGPLGCALRAERRKLLLSQASLAKTAGVHQTQVSKLELGAPNWTLFCRLIDALGGRPIVTVEPRSTGLEALARLAATVW